MLTIDGDRCAAKSCSGKSFCTGCFIVLILGIILLTAVFQVQFYDPGALALICFLFLLCLLGMGLSISAVSRTQTQAIQFSVFFLLPVFVLWRVGTVNTAPAGYPHISELFPLTHFCRAFRLVNLPRGTAILR